MAAAAWLRRDAQHRDLKRHRRCLAALLRPRRPAAGGGGAAT
eukprot:CAMPEP_0194687784 /NCGR_PEP_ID=MMETSP0295-20121207/16488_1 /TAXON_ID=39354 /ORGANISM="Heterosigma akashiwo, Strain CCMP2393" /LENGTH=41 /DNA_ID= /DNA_START= /DNA_END= /DNA_ORIENTATION=